MGSRLERKDKSNLQMKLQEAIKYQGKPFYIPDCSRMELPEFFKNMGFVLGAEIGVYKGKYCEKFCLAGINMYAIDPWKDSNLQRQQRQDYLYNYAKKVLEKTKKCVVIRKSSMDAVKNFENESLDFVYIDADHSYNETYNDIHYWYKIVKKGGIISGHDYEYSGNENRALQAYNATCQVKKAVDDFIKEMNIKNFYTFGRSKKIELESKNDRYLSWMFFK